MRLYQVFSHLQCRSISLLSVDILETFFMFNTDQLSRSKELPAISKGVTCHFVVGTKHQTSVRDPGHECIKALSDSTGDNDNKAIWTLSST